MVRSEVVASPWKTVTREQVERCFGITMESYKTLAGKRVRLRPANGSDVPYAQALHGDASNRYYVHRGGPANPAEVVTWMQTLTGQDDARLLAIEHHALGRPVGFIWFEAMQAAGGCLVSIGLTELHGVGIGMEACLLGAVYIFGRENQHRATAPVVRGNLASQRVMLRLGFKHEGTQREQCWIAGRREDLIMYGLLQSEAFEYLPRG